VSSPTLHYTTLHYTISNRYHLLPPLPHRDRTLARLVDSSITCLPAPKEKRQSSISSRRFSNESNATSEGEGEHGTISTRFNQTVISRSCAQREDLRQRLDSKSILANYMADLYDTCATHMMCNEYTVRVLLLHESDLIRSISTGDHYEHRGRDIQDTADLLFLIAKYFGWVGFFKVYSSVYLVISCLCMVWSLADDLHFPLFSK
jgi:hypothetical protein